MQVFNSVFSGRRRHGWQKAIQQFRMASNTVLFRSIWVSNQILVKLSSQNGGNKSFVCWRCTDWQGMCFPTKIITLWSFNHSSQIKPKYFPETKTLAYQFSDLKEIFAKINEHSHEWNFDGGGSGRNDALREYYIQLCNKWTPKIVFLGKNFRVGDFFVLRFSSIKCGGVPPLLR